MEDLLSIFGIILIFGLFAYLYVLIVLKLTKLAKRFKIKKHLWFLWIPFLSGYIIHQMADTKLWTFILSLLFFIPILNLATYIMPIVWYWKIEKKLDYPGWWALIWPLWLIILDLETED